MSIKAGIIGAAGYTGGEMIRLLLHHPSVQLAFAHSSSQAGRPVAHTHSDLAGETSILFTGEWHTDIDVLFLCVGHGEAKKWLAAHQLPAHIKIIDLSQDFRLQDSTQPMQQHFVYGLPEANRTAIRTATHVANPGCFATALQLGLLPLAANGLLQDVYATGITGATGAGQSLQASSHFAWRANNIQAYKTLTHQHMAEVQQTLSQSAGAASGMRIHFVPWRGDFARGIFVTLQTPYTGSQEDVYQLYEAWYATHPFTHVSRDPIHLKQVVNTNKAMVQPELVNGQLAIHVAIDNLLKGASGQAVQNMNLLFGLEETAGLQLKASFF